MFLADHDDSDDENDPDLLMTLSSELGPVSYVTVARGLGHNRPIRGQLRVSLTNQKLHGDTAKSRP